MLSSPLATASPSNSPSTSPQNNNRKKSYPLALIEPMLDIMGSVSKNLLLHLTDRGTIDGQTSTIKNKVRVYNDTVNKIKEAIDAYKNDDSKKMQQLYVAQLESYNAVSEKSNEELQEESKKKLKGENVEKMLQDKQELDNKNFNQIFSRIFTSLVFGGALDIMDIFGSVLDNFGGDFSTSVGKTIGDEKVMGGFAGFNKDFGIDKIFEGLSKFPILNDLNQFTVDALGSEYLSPISGMARDFMGGEVAKLAFTGLVVANFVNKESNIFQEYRDFKTDHDKALDIIAKTPQEIIDNKISSIAKLIANNCFQSNLDYEYLDSYLHQDIRGDNSRNKSFILKDGTSKKLSEIKISDIGNIDFETDSRKESNNQNFKLLLADAKEFINDPTNKAIKDQKDQEVLDRLINIHAEKKSQESSPPSDIDALKSKIKANLDQEDSFEKKKKKFCEEYMVPEIEKELRKNIEASQEVLKSQNQSTVSNILIGGLVADSASLSGEGAVRPTVSADLGFATSTPPASPLPPPPPPPPPPASSPPLLPQPVPVSRGPSTTPGPPLIAERTSREINDSHFAGKA